MQNLNPSFTISPQLAAYAIEMLSSAKWCSEKQPAGARLSTLRETIPQGQGDFALRKTIVQLTEQNFHLLSPHFLRQLDKVNLQLRLILQCKRIGHALGFKGEFPLPDGTKLPFESFNETFVFPMLRSSFALFTGKQKQLLYPSAELHQPGLGNCNNINADQLQQDMDQIFSQAIWHDNATDERLNKIHLQIHDPSYHFPILIGTGYDWHSTQLIFFKDTKEDYFIYCNRGNDCGPYPGWVMSRIGDKTPITIEWLKNLTLRLNATSDNYFSVKRITSDLKGSLIFFSPMQIQSAGICTYASLEAAIFALLTLWIASQQFTMDIFHNNYDLLSKSLPASKKIYNQFINFDCHLVLNDFLMDIKKLSAQAAGDNSDANTTIASVARHQILDITPKYPPLYRRIGWPLWTTLTNEILKLGPTLKTKEISSRIEFGTVLSQFSTAEELLVNGIEFVQRVDILSYNEVRVHVKDLLDTISDFESYQVVRLEEKELKILIDRTIDNISFAKAQKIINSTDFSSDIKVEFLKELFNTLNLIECVDMFIWIANKVSNKADYQALKKALCGNIGGFFIADIYQVDDISYQAFRAVERELMEDSCNLTEWNMWSSSRNTLILWNQVAKALDLSQPSSYEYPSLSQFIQNAKRFPEWLQINEMALNRLETLHLENTSLGSLARLTLLPKEIGLFTNLKTLVIKNNPIDSFPKEFSNLTNLTHLTCIESRMNRMPEEIRNLINLKELNFSDLSPLHFPIN